MENQIVTKNRSLTEETEALLNKQIGLEGLSSSYYLAMASWCDKEGYVTSSEFLYRHAEEERQHMLKLVKFINERGGHAIVPSLDQPDSEFNSLMDVFEQILKHEEGVTQSINEIVDQCLKEKDHSTNNFMQWYVSEQLEEESLAKSIIDKLNLIGTDSAGLYLFDRELGGLIAQG